MGPYHFANLLVLTDGRLLASVLPAFIGVAALVIMTPGPDTALTIRNALFGGRGAGVATAAGVVTGQAVWAFGTSIGIVGLLVMSQPVFVAVKLLGAAYLVFLGVQSIRAALTRTQHAEPADSPAPRRDLRPGRAFRQGLVNDLSNPKMAAFFTSLLPQFVPSPDVSFVAPIALGLIFCMMTFAWLALYVAVVARVDHVLRRPKIRRALEGFTGVVLVGLGIRLASEHR